mgnify:CR=1 FL=1
MVYFTDIQKTQHYIDYHEIQVPWEEVVKIIIFSSKIIKKKGDKLEIENENYYLLCHLSGNILYVINAKRK